jgi:hypothetical protein
MTVDLMANRVLYERDLSGRIRLDPNNVVLSSGALVLFQQDHQVAQTNRSGLTSRSMDSKRKALLFRY